MKNYKPSYEYLAKVVRVVDGDTIILMIDKGLRDYSEVRLRLHGVNAPELKKDSKISGLASKKRLEELLPNNKEVFVKTFKDKLDPYGRYVAKVFIDDETRDISTILVEEGFAVTVDY